MTKLSTQPLKGFRDLYPEDFALQKWMFDKFRETVQQYGYQEYEGPILEPKDLYAAKSGEELVREQTFLLDDRGGRTLALRPELTPTLARMVARKRFDIPIPIRWFSIGPRFRYEAPQKGRGREFYQMDVDLVGVSSPIADAEILALALQFLGSLGVTKKDVVMKINNKKQMQQKLSGLKLSSDGLVGVFRAIDRRDKMDSAKWYAYLESTGLSGNQTEQLKKILDDQNIVSEELKKTVSILNEMGFNGWFEYDPTVVRGLEYYTGTVFEVRDRKGKFRALAGGGRYDNLVEMFDTEPLSGIGFACGDMVLMELLNELNILPDLKLTSSTVLVSVFNNELAKQSLSLANQLRNKNISTELSPDPTVKLDKQLKYADRKNIPYVIIIGPDEQVNNQLLLKDMKKKSQQNIGQKEFLADPQQYLQ